MERKTAWTRRLSGKGLVQMANIAVIGDKDSVQGFLALGLSVYAERDAADAEERLKTLAREGCAIIYITENLAQHMMDTIARYSASMTPAVILIPNNAGSLGLGMTGVRQSVERAVGADILFGGDA